MSSESPPARSPDLTPEMEAEAWVLHDLQEEGFGALAEAWVPNHKTGGIDPLYVAFAACPQARVAMDTSIKGGERHGESPLTAATYFVQDQQESMTPAQNEAFLKSAQTRI